MVELQPSKLVVWVRFASPARGQDNLNASSSEPASHGLRRYPSALPFPLREEGGRPAFPVTRSTAPEPIPSCDTGARPLRLRPHRGLLSAPFPPRPPSPVPE